MKNIHFPPGAPPALSIVIPAYNEASRLEIPLRQIADYLDAQSYSSEILVVDDGSDDRTFEIAKSVAMDARIGIGALRYSRNRGKGFALKVGFERAAGDILLFCDADLATPIEQTARLLAALEHGVDLVIGSRKMPGAKVTTRQPACREQLGKGFTWLVRRAIADVSDVTCGFKAFRRRAGKDLFRLVRLYDWSFDAEVLMLAVRKGLVLVEVPVAWEDKPGTKVRLHRDIPRSLANLGRLRWNLLTGAYQKEHQVTPHLEEFFNPAWHHRFRPDAQDEVQHAGS